MSRLHGARLLPGGGLRVRISAREHELLRDLALQLREVLGGRADPGGASARLFPRAYDDDELEQEYRELVGADLRSARLESLEAFAASLERGANGRLGWSVDLDPEEADSWLSVVNDTRLTLGALLDIESEDAWQEGPDHDEPASVALWYLGWLEEQLVGAMMGALEDGA
jgi:hypothetical protein